MKKKNNSLIHHIFYCQIYKCYVLLYIGCAEDAIEHLDNEYDISIEEDWGSCIGMTFQENTDERTYYVVWIKNPKDIPTMVHECLHLAYRILGDRMISLNIDNQETIAYYLSYWFEIILKLSKMKEGEKWQNP